MKKRREDEAARPLQEAMDGAGKRSMPENLSSAKAGEKGEDTATFISGGKRYARTPGAQKKFIKRIPDGQLVVVPDIRHEIYRAPNSVLQPYLEMIFEFYDSGEKSPVKKEDRQKFCFPADDMKARLVAYCPPGWYDRGNADGHSLHSFERNGD